MIISYPIITAGAISSDEGARLQDFLATYVDSASGFFPVSFEDRWHGGIHLKPGNEPLRAIADGEVIAYRVAVHPETYPDVGDYDTSFVLLKHTTETGENTPVVFYSLLMHLLGRGHQTANQRKQLPDWLQSVAPSPSVKPGNGTKVWRKDILGFCGKYLNESRVHFEIFTTDTDLGNFWKDSSAYASTNDASNDWFGDAGFVIPSGNSFLASHPHEAAISGLMTAPAEAPVAGNNSDTTVGPPSLDSGLAGAPDQDQSISGAVYVNVRLAKGDRIATSFKRLLSGKFVQIGQPIVQKNYEYQLYHLANKLYPDCPSAGFEWLRFGRVLGPDTTTTKENWQLVRYDDTKSGYINLAADSIIKLSDADFPFWAGWQKITEGTAVNAQDGICDVPQLLELLHGSAPTTSATPSMADQKTDFIQHASAQDVSEGLRFVIAQNPSEWDDSDLATRYATERKPGGDLAEATSWTNFSDHVKKMAFWSSTGLDRSIWHFHPVQFVSHYRRCLWLTQEEAVQCVPRKFVAEYHSTHTLYRASTPHNVAEQRISRICTELNRMSRKFNITSGVRLSCFLANAIVESAYLARYYELGRGVGHSYGDWYGRGIIQLTHQASYLKYFGWRGWSATNMAQNIAHRDAVANDNHERTESAGYWWASNNANETCDTPGHNANWNITVCENFDWHSHLCVGRSAPETRLSNSTLDLVGRQVNTGSPTTTHAMNGLPERRDIFINDQAVLTDTLYLSTTVAGAFVGFPAYLTRQI